MEFESYEDLVEGLRNLPVTWFPALIKVLIDRSIDLKVWNGEDGLANFLCKVIDHKKGGKNDF